MCLTMNRGKNVFLHIICCQVKKMAPDFYDNLPYHTSWMKVIWDFIFCADIGPYARVRRRRSPESAAELDEDKDQKLD